MSKIDELMRVFNRAKWDHLRSGGDYEQVERAGIRAVIAAVRDEMQSTIQEYSSPECCGMGAQTYYTPPECCGKPLYKIDTDRVFAVFNEILASEGGQVAGDPLPHLSEREKALFVAALKGDAGPTTLPAAPAPVCKWVHSDEKTTSSCMRDGVTNWMWNGRFQDKCPNCWNPIKFTEAKT